MRLPSVKEPDRLPKFLTDEQVLDRPRTSADLKITPSGSKKVKLPRSRLTKKVGPSAEHGAGCDGLANGR